MNAPAASSIRAWRLPGGLALSPSWVEAALLVAGLAAISAIRWSATLAGGDALLVGVGFGLALAALAILPRGGLDVSVDARSVALGAAFGLALVGAVIVAPGIAGTTHLSGLARPNVQFVPWALATVLVATAEEVVLRGVLFDRLRRAGGIGVALAFTTVLFALLHVPVYGWHVVPLDLAVGLGLGGLRIVTRGIAASATAHALADLATWWL